MREPSSNTQWEPATLRRSRGGSEAHTGPLATEDGDVGPTGLTIDLRFADIARVRDQKIVAYHTYYDQLGLLTQLGLMEGG
jgi:ketosteroid isomerase-like protein